MSGVGRNDPCPCGSGKKYKRCCLGKDDDAPATPIVNVDGVVTGAVIQWVAGEHRDRLDHARSLLADEIWESEESATLLAHLLAWETPAADGLPICLGFPERRTYHLDPRERDWLDQQQRSWFSLWDIVEVRRDEGLFLRDLLTGVERFVRERMATHYAVERSVMLARISRLGDVWTLAASHPRQLPPRAADPVVAEARRALKLGRGTVEPARLRGEPAWRLAALWNDAVDALLRAPRPEIRNTEGDELVLTKDHFSFAPADRDRVLARLRATPDLEEEEEDAELADELQSHLFSRVRIGEDGESRLRLAQMELGDMFLVAQSNSTSRADDMRALLEARLSGLVRFVDREESDYWDAMEAEGDPDDDWDEEGRRPAARGGRTADPGLQGAALRDVAGHSAARPGGNHAARSRPRQASEGLPPARRRAARDRARRGDAALRATLRRGDPAPRARPLVVVAKGV